MDEIQTKNPKTCIACGLVLDAPDVSPDDACAACGPTELTGVRALYRRLAAAYDEQPTVPDCRGGVVGDRYPF